MSIQEDGPHFRRLGEGAQRRFWVKRDKKKILEFVVQLEVDVAGAWKLVVRYDTEHGVPHRDVHRMSGRQEEKEWLASLSFDKRWGHKRAFEFAIEDVENNWETYRDRFLGKRG